MLVGTILLLGFSQMASTLVFLNYKINQDYISEFLCINKDKPDSCCEGKCYLKAELNELSGSESNEDQHRSLWQDWRWITSSYPKNLKLFPAAGAKHDFISAPEVIEKSTSPPSPPPQLIA